MRTYSPQLEPSPQDRLYLRMIRESVQTLLERAAGDVRSAPGRVLEVGPDQEQNLGACLGPEFEVHTMDLGPDAKCTYQGDITCRNDFLPSGIFDYVVCLEVLEHTLQPFAAVEEIRRLLRPGGLLYLSAPFNFRLHGPLPDCWRFSEHGLRALLTGFEILSLEGLETPERPLMPIHYRVVASRRAE